MANMDYKQHLHLVSLKNGVEAGHRVLKNHGGGPAPHTLKLPLVHALLEALLLVFGAGLRGIGGRLEHALTVQVDTAAGNHPGGRLDEVEDGQGGGGLPRAGLAHQTQGLPDRKSVV